MGKIAKHMGRAVLIALAIALASCAPEPTSREQLLDGVFEMKQQQRRQRVQIEEMQKQLQQIDSLIRVYEQLP